MRKAWKIIKPLAILSPTLVLIGIMSFLIIVAAMLSAIVAAVTSSSTDSVSPIFSPAVQRYRSVVGAECLDSGIPEWSINVLAIMEILTKGEGKDPMKAQGKEFNESNSVEYGNQILIPEYSIYVGVKEIAWLINKIGIESPRDDDKKLLLLYQSYYGTRALIDTVKKNGGIDQYDMSGWEFAHKVHDFVTRANMFTNVNGQLLWPCPSSTYITSHYGGRNAPVAGASTNHKGIDIGASGGADIIAAASGNVTTVAYNSARGNYIIIDHGTSTNGDNIKTLYQHCSKIYAVQGQMVQQEEVIAAVGSTGYSSGNHLHFEVLINGINVDPEDYIGVDLFESSNITGNGNGLKYTSADLDLVSRLLYCEAGASWLTDEFQRLVVSVLVNHVNSPYFPNTIRECIYHGRDYEPVLTGKIDRVVPDARTIANAKYVLDNGPICPENVIYQANFRQGSGVYKQFYDSILGTTSYFCYQ